MPRERGARYPLDRRNPGHGERVQSFHPTVANCPTVTANLIENISRETRLMSDQSRLYIKVGKTFASHETVTHTSGESLRGDVHTNSVEGYFSIFKRGMRGVYQHCKEKHLHRYLKEYDLRHNHRVKLGFNDGERAVLAVKSAADKRPTYRERHQASFQTGGCAIFALA